MWSGGTDGVISPHATIFATVPPEDAVAPSDEPRLTVGFAMSEQLLPEDIGRTAMITKVADAVKVAMEKAGITDPADVHYVQTKTPLLTIHTIRDAKSRGKTVWTEETHQSMDLSNGCTALGIAVALGEIEMPTDADVMHNRDLYSAVASCSSGVELDQAQVVVVGNAPGVGGRYRIGHSVMKDALDQDGIWDAIREAGLELPERPRTSDLDGKLVNVFLKCEASQDGRSAADATRCSTTPTCTGTARSRPQSAVSPPPSPATRRCSCRSPRPTRAPTAAGRSPPSSTSAESTRGPARVVPARLPDRVSPSRTGLRPSAARRLRRP